MKEVQQQKDATIATRQWSTFSKHCRATRQK